jgi:hypothetical protein
MIRQFILSCVAFGVMILGTASAQDTTTGTAQLTATVRISEPVLADGKPLAPGTYQLVVTNERPAVASVPPSDNQRVVEFMMNGTVVAREVAEVFPRGERPVVGTSGSRSARAVVEKLRDGDFVRVSFNGAGARYLIHLPTGQAPAQP